jgi:hypothetical protein
MVNFSLFEPSQMTTEGCLPQGMSPVAHFSDMPVRPRDVPCGWLPRCKGKLTQNRVDGASFSQPFGPGQNTSPKQYQSHSETNDPTGSKSGHLWSNRVIRVTVFDPGRRRHCNQVEIIFGARHGHI